MQSITCNVARLPGGDDTRTGTDSRGMARGVTFVPRVDPPPPTRSGTLGDGERVVAAWESALNLVRLVAELAAGRHAPPDPEGWRWRWERAAFGAVLAEWLTGEVPEGAGELWVAKTVLASLPIDGGAGAAGYAAALLSVEVDAIEAEAGRGGAA